MELPPRLFALLLMLLEWTRPGLPSPMRPICDLRVLKHFIEEARDAQAAMLTCKEGRGLPEPVTVPQTKVDFNVWERKNALEQAQEVQSGLWLLNQAISSLRASVTNTALQSHIDNSLINIFRIGKVLRSLNIQEYTPPAEGVSGGEETWRVSSASELLQVHVNFLRGKVQLLLSNAPVCYQGGS
ncbi:erythropoietin-like isoform X2 [Coregonus clupeaformis]|uniref:erythropoietin-like isoform X2 n=1 Tax=Coregonus clupeaformis TaxID=59861 RepID=UPI001E1C9BF7|nr:erythropoietin-like isoform X2 [Coregonus clupeaformis]